MMLWQHRKHLVVPVKHICLTCLTTLDWAVLNWATYRIENRIKGESSSNNRVHVVVFQISWHNVKNWGTQANTHKQISYFVSALQASIDTSYESARTNCGLFYLCKAKEIYFLILLLYLEGMCELGGFILLLLLSGALKCCHWIS